MSGQGWRVFQNCLLGVATADSATLPVVLGTLFRVAQASNQTVSKGPLASVLEPIIAAHAVRAHGSEVAWAIWGALAWGIRLDAAAADAISLMDDDVVAILALEADSRGLFPPGSLDTNLWHGFAASPTALKGEHWLLAYEGHIQKWLTTPAIATHPVFKPMAAANISFFDRTQNVPQFPAAGQPIPGSTLA